MKLLVEKKKLTKAIELANVNDNSELLFSCDGYELIIAGKNADMYVEFTFDVEADEPGEIVVAGKDLHKILKGFNADNIEISANLEAAFFRTPADAPVQSGIKLDAVATEMVPFASSESIKLFKGVAKDIAAKMITPINGVDKKAVKPELRDLGVVLNDKLTFVSFCSTSFARNTINLETPVAEQRKRLTLTAVKAAYKMLKGGKTEVEVSLGKVNGEDYLVFRNGHSVIYLKTKEGYPDYFYLEKVTPSEEVEITNALGIFTAIPAAAKVDATVELDVKADKVNVSLCDSAVTTNFINPCKSSSEFKFKTNGKRLKEAFSGTASSNVVVSIVPNKVFIISDGEYKFIGSLIH